MNFAFQELCHPESTYLGKAPTAKLTRVGAADRLFFVPLTRITSVSGCAVSFVGFLWGPGAVPPTRGVFVGSAEVPDSAQPTEPVAQLLEADHHFQVTYRHQGGPAYPR
jgi:hypothetical protein